jgi:hypothetical protein
MYYFLNPACEWPKYSSSQVAWKSASKGGNIKPENSLSVGSLTSVNLRGLALVARWVGGQRIVNLVCGSVSLSLGACPESTGQFSGADSSLHVPPGYQSLITWSHRMTFISELSLYLVKQVLMRYGSLDNNCKNTN